MNPFATLIDPAAAMSAHGTLVSALKRTAIVTPVDPEEDEPEPAKHEPRTLAYEVVSRRIYRPKGLTLALLMALQDGNYWTAAELAPVIQRGAKEIGSLLAVPVQHGIVRQIDAAPKSWALA
jgi:hypothetical protein